MRIIIVFTTNRKKPKVNTVIGIVSIVNKGFTKIFNKPITATNNIAACTSSTLTNQNNLVQPITTATLKAILKNYCNIENLFFIPSKIQKQLVKKNRCNLLNRF